VEKMVVDNAVFCLSIALSVPEIFAIKVYICSKSSSLLITLEPLLKFHEILRAYVLRQPLKLLLNFKVIGQRSRS